MLLQTPTEDTLEQVVYDGVRFLQSLTTHYGAEKGMEIWEAIGTAVGKEVKGRVFFAMMTGETTGRVKFTTMDISGYNPNTVQCIKTIRTYTGWGLKEAKDKWDESKLKVVHIDCPTPEDGRRLAIELRNLGCRIY
jgi:ribosomal protein L7/L12